MRITAKRQKLLKTFKEKTVTEKYSNCIEIFNREVQQ
jgi:hypothetical protein